MVQLTKNRITLIYIVAFTTMAVSFLVLTGWLLDVAYLKSLISGFPQMKPNTAIAFAITGAGLFSLARSMQVAGWRKAIVVCGALVFLVGAVTLGEYVFGSSLGTDKLFINGMDSDGGDQFSGYMSPHAAFNFAIIGLSIICIKGGRFVRKASEFLVLLTAVSTFSAILGHLYDAEQLFGFSKHNNMALHTIAMFFLSSFGLLIANSGSNTVRLLTSDSLGGNAARRLLPAVVLIPSSVGWLWMLGQKRGLYDTGFGAALSMFSCVILMVGIVLYFSRKIHKADRARKMVEHELIEKEQRYRDLFDYSQGMICIHDLEGVLLTINPAMLNSLKYFNEEMVGMNLRDFLPVEHRPRVDTYLREVGSKGISNGFLTVETKYGKEVVWRYHNILVSEPGKEPYVLGHAQDVTELLEAQKQLRNLSLTDELTGLYNRRGFLTMAEQQLKLERHEKTARGVTLMFADMDGLKQINDLHGHEAGSEAIVALSKIINSALRGSDLVARWGGDEFVILTIGSKDDDAEIMLERITDRIAQHNAGSDKPYQLACSIGLAPIPLDRSLTFESIIAEADKAMYTEKQRRKASREIAAKADKALPIPSPAAISPESKTFV